MALDGQQRKLLQVLIEAEAAPVSYEALERAGVKGPASRVYELESRGHSIERVYERRPEGRRLVGVRLSGEERAALRRFERQAREQAQQTRSRLSQLTLRVFD